jgi:hypothetical protein
MRVGDNKTLPLGLGQIELSAGEKVIHVKITGFGMLLMDTNLLPANARLMVKDLLSTYENPQIKEMSRVAGSSYIDSGKEVLKEINEWIEQVTNR